MINKDFDILRIIELLCIEEIFEFTFNTHRKVCHGHFYLTINFQSIIYCVRTGLVFKIQLSAWVMVHLSSWLT